MKDALKDPYVNLLYAVWQQAVKDINKSFLLEHGVLDYEEGSEKAKEIQENAEQAMDWIMDDTSTFTLVATAFQIPIPVLRDNTLKKIEQQRKVVSERSKKTTKYIYMTVSRFRDYKAAYDPTDSDK